MPLSNKHRRTLEAVFKNPTPVSVECTDIEALISALGGVVEQRAGLRVAFRLGDRVLTGHAPHPQKEAKRAMVRDVRDFLEAAGIKP